MHVWLRVPNSLAHMFGFIANAIGNALLEPLKILVDITLFLQDQHSKKRYLGLVSWYCAVLNDRVTKVNRY